MSRTLSTIVCALAALAATNCSIGLPGGGGPSSIIIYAATAGGVQESATGGSRWTAVGSLTNVNTVVSVSSGSFISVFAGTSSGLYLCTDGATWTPFSGLASAVDWIQLSGVSIYAATSVGVSVSATTDVATTWASTAISGGASRIYFDGTNTFAATSGGLWVSNSTSTTTYTTANGLPTNAISAVSSDGTNVWVGTANNGMVAAPMATLSTTPTWTQYTNAGTAGELASDTIHGIYAYGTTIYAATSAGLSVFAGLAWTTILSGMSVNSVYVSGTDIYAATATGLWISANGGVSWTQNLAGVNVLGVSVE